MSKHKFEAKEHWLQLQDKLQRGIVDEETQKIYETAKDAKNLSRNSSSVVRKNLSQMLDFNKRPTTASVSNHKNKENEDVNSLIKSFIQKIIYINHNQLTQSIACCEHNDLETCQSEVFSTKTRSTTVAAPKPKSDKEFLKSIDNQLHETRNFITKMEKCSCGHDPKYALKVLFKDAEKKM